MSSFEQDYREAMEELYLSAGSFGTIAASLGTPRANESIPTAQVSWNQQDKLTVFEINPRFFHDLTPRERGAIIAHETYHVLLGHLQEASDPYYRNTQTRIYAQECIINDGLPSSTGLPLPLGSDEARPCLGPEMFGADFSYFTTRQGYDYIMGRNKEEESKDDASPSATPSSGDGKSQGEQSDSSQEQDPSENEPAGNEQQDSPESDGSNTPENSLEDTDEDGAEDSESGTDEPLKDEANQGDTETAPGGGEGEESHSDTSEPSEAGKMTPGTLCGGVEMNGGDPQEIKQSISNSMKHALSQMSKEEIQELSDEITDMLVNAGIGGSIIGTNDAGSLIVAKESTLNVNWRKILERVNPKVKDYGKRKRGDDWTRPNPRYVSIYPKVVLPRALPSKPQSKGKGDSLPTIIVALDLSYSIPRELVKDLLALVQDTPEDLVRAIPVTWSDYPKEYDQEKREIVKAGGTDVTNLYHWCINRGKELGITNPHVFVITDGETSFYGKVDREYIRSKWHWCLINPRDESSLRRNFKQYLTEKNVHHLSDFH